MLEMEGRVVGDQSPTIDTPRIPRANPYSECPASNERWGDKGGLSLIWQRSTPPLHPPSLPFSNSFYAYGPPSGENNPFASNPFLQRRKRKGREKVCVPRPSCADANVCGGCSEEEREREERDRIGGGGGSGTGKWKGRGRRQRVGGLEGAVEKKGEEVRLVWQREGGVGVELGTSRADDE